MSEPTTNPRAAIAKEFAQRVAARKADYQGNDGDLSAMEFYAGAVAMCALLLGEGHGTTQGLLAGAIGVATGGKAALLAFGDAP